MVALTAPRVKSVQAMTESNSSEQSELTLRWVGEAEAELVARTRMLCYGTGQTTIDKYRESVRVDLLCQPRQFLLAELDGQPVGTTTSLDLTMWSRGTPVPCQGVAYVGTVKTHRRIASGSAK